MSVCTILAKAVAMSTADKKTGQVGIIIHSFIFYCHSFNIMSFIITYFW